MKKIIVLFIITILLSGCNSNLEKEKQYKKVNKDNETCLEGEPCNFLKKSDKRLESIPDKEGLDNNQNSNEIVNDNIVGVEDGNQIIDNQDSNEEELDNNEENDDQINDSEEELDNNEENDDQINDSEEELDNNEENDDQINDSEEDSGEKEINNQTYLAFGDIIDNVIPILFNSNEDIAGFQFSLFSNNEDIIIIDTYGGIAEESNIDVMVGDGTNIVLGISLEGNIISESTGILTNLEFENLNIQGAEICISDIVISAVNGDNLNTVEQICINI